VQPGPEGLGHDVQRVETLEEHQKGNGDGARPNATGMPETSISSVTTKTISLEWSDSWRVTERLARLRARHILGILLVLNAERRARPVTTHKISATYCRMSRPSPTGIERYGIQALPATRCSTATDSSRPPTNKPCREQK
jgi:hypothetical protein